MSVIHWGDVKMNKSVYKYETISFLKGIFKVQDELSSIKRT